MEGRFFSAPFWGGIVSLLLTCTAPCVHAAVATDPAQAVNRMLEAARNHDGEAFLSGLTADSRRALLASYAQQEAARRLERDIRRALDGRFGPGAPILETPPDTLAAAMARLATGTVIGQKPRPDGAVEVTVDTPVVADGGVRRMRTDTLLVRKERGSWKLLLGFSAEDLGTNEPKRRAVVERTLQDVREGKYQDRFSAMLALANALAGLEGSQP